VHTDIVNSQQPGDPPWLAVARVEIGVKERVGAADNPRIIEYHKTTRLRATSDSVPWCSSFVNWCLKQAGYLGTRSAAAASFRTWGVRCELKPGAIVVFGKADPDAVGTGHVGFVDHFDDDWVWVLGGNQSNSVNIAKRPLSRVVAVRWPTGKEP
jgi:uncharacterized protein (TIGR02594 family)